jgi:hypothetical protein
MDMRGENIQRRERSNSEAKVFTSMIPSSLCFHWVISLNAPHQADNLTFSMKSAYFVSNDTWRPPAVLLQNFWPKWIPSIRN